MFICDLLSCLYVVMLGFYGNSKLSLPYNHLQKCITFYKFRLNIRITNIDYKNLTARHEQPHKKNTAIIDYKTSVVI